MKMYVIAHKKIELLPDLPDNYMRLQVGTSITGKFNGTWNYDNIGENISEKNPSYNELTGLYWIWKNSKEDIVGLCHYRRYFVTYLGKIKNLLFNQKSNFIDEKYIKDKLEKYDIILHNKTFFKEGNAEQFRKTQKHPEDIDIIKQIITEKYPEYKDSFNKIMRSKTCHLLNVFICKKEIIDEYCKWLFDILFEFESRLDKSGEKDFSRRMGMIGERLFDVWILQNKLKVCECCMINTERNDWKPW